MVPAQPDGLQVGAVSYLNAKPLIWGVDSATLILDVPSRLAFRFYAGEFDVALQPIFATLKEGGGLLVDDAAIACRGPVYSVFVASRTAFEESGDIYLDPSSRSSSALLRTLVAEFHARRIRVVEAANIPENAARLLIGNPAIQFRLQHPEGWQFHDLGEIWQKHTGLPFVFAAWTVAQTVVDPVKVADYLRSIKAGGLAARSQIAAAEEDPVFALKYLTDYIRFDLREEEKKAIRLFSELAARHGLLSGSAPSVAYC